MRLRSFFHFIRDLIQILPTTVAEEWANPETLHGDRTTVILVSGFAATHRNLSIIRKRLIRDGYNVLVLSLDWSTLAAGVTGLHRMAEKLSRMVLGVRKGSTRKVKVFLVAHSAGGLVARYYVQLLGGSHYCEGLVTLATPHSGTWLAVFGFFTHLMLRARYLFQLLPFSPFIRDLNRAPFPTDIKMLSISSRDDLMCPRSAAHLPFAQQANVQTVEIPYLSHGDFLMSKSSYQTLVNFVKRETAEKPTPETAKVTS